MAHPTQARMPTAGCAARTDIHASLRKQRKTLRAASRCAWRTLRNADSQPSGMPRTDAHPHWPSQAQAGALPWAPRSMGGHGGREARRAAYHTPRRRTLPMQAPGQGPGPGLGGGGNPWKRQAPPAGPPCLRLAWGGQCPRTPAELSPGGWCLAPRPQASAQGRRPGFGIRPWHRPWQGSPGSGQRVTGLSPKHATAGEARTGRLCPQHRRPPWTRRWQSPSRVVSWSEGLGPDRPSRA